MKNKIIILLVTFFAITVSSFAYAFIVYPTDLTIVVNSQGSDSIFNFRIQHLEQECTWVCDGDECLEGHEECSDMWRDQEFFSLQTNDSMAYKNFPDITPSGKYRVIEEVSTGFKIDNITCNTNDSSINISVGYDSFSFWPGSRSVITCTFNNSKIIEKTPVLIVPGIMGTEIKESDILLWADLNKMFGNLTDSFMNNLAFKNDLSPFSTSTIKGEIIKKLETALGLISFDYSDRLVNEFKNQGYVENETLFTFPYDWRYGVSGKYADGKTNSDLLKEKIQAIMAQTGASKVNVVAHSMGGLIVKKYVTDNQTNSHIDKAVFVGVPNTGSVEAVKTLLQGDNFDIPWLNDAEVKKISANMPSSYDLLPSQKYYDIKGSFMTIIDKNQSTQKDLNYNETKSFLIDDNGLNPLGVSNAESLHAQSFDDYDIRTAGVDLYAIDGCKAPTLSQIMQIKSNTGLVDLIDYRNIKWGLGDGTVPIESATNLPIDQSKKYYSLTGEHSKMLGQNGTRQQIVNLISGSSLDTGKDFLNGDNLTGDIITQDASKCQLDGKAIMVFSPIDISVTDQNGNKLGLAEDQSVSNNIPGANFQIWGEHKFIYLPTDGGQTYAISMQGTGTGTYTIKVQDIVNSQARGTEVFSNLPVTPQLTGQINLGSQTTLTINGKTILPTATLSANQSDDYLAPVSTATLVGAAGQASFYRSDVKISIKATDNLSGVLNVSYKLDNSESQKVTGDNAEFSISSEGKHTLRYFGTDKAGNDEQEKTIEFTIDKAAPEAVIEFDTIKKDLKFSGKDNISDSSLVSVLDKNNTATLTDQAGNTTEISFYETNRKISMRAGIKSLKYNGAPVAKFQNMMVFYWLYDKKNNLITLSQSALTKKGYNILAFYNGMKTAIAGRDAGGLIAKSFNGLKLLKVTTSKGDLQWSY